MRGEKERGVVMMEEERGRERQTERMDDQMMRSSYDGAAAALLSKITFEAMHRQCSGSRRHLSPRFLNHRHRYKSPSLTPVTKQEETRKPG